MKAEDIEGIIQPKKISIKIKIVNDVIVAPIHGAVLILDGNLKTTKCYVTIKTDEWNKYDGWARSIDGNEDFIAVGYRNGEVYFFDRSGDDEPTVRPENNIELINFF